MGKQRTKFMVGLFMAGGLAIAVVAVIWLGMSRFLEKGRFYAVYFDESVQGLTVDSPVKYRGVAIGRVDRILVAPDSKLIEVVMKVESGLKVENDMVAQLKVVGITGSMFIELDRITAGTPARSPKLSFPTEYPVVVTRPSDINELFRGIDDIIQKLNSLDIAGISDRLKTTLEHTDEAIRAADLGGVSKSVKEAVERMDRTMAAMETDKISAELRTAIASLNQDFDPERWTALLDNLGDRIDSIKGVIENADSMLSGANGTVRETGAGMTALSRQLLVVSQELEKASRNLNRILDQTADQPSQLLFGDPPPVKNREQNIREK